MTVPAISDEEFMELWREHKSAVKISKITGSCERNVHKRRRNLELKYDVDLKAKEGVSIQKHSGCVNLEIQNGIVIVFSDAHFQPGIDTTAFRALLTLIKQLKPKAVINNGDALDFGAISRFPRIGWDNKPTVMDELKAAERAIGMIEAVSGNAQLVWPLGNHDARLETFLANRVPEFQGMGGFHLKDYFPKWKPCWACKINDNVTIKHRFKGGLHATHNNTLWAGHTTVTGHLHSLKVTPFTDYNGTRWGVDTGTLADPSGPHDLDYTEANPLNHRSGFAILTFRNGDLLDPELVRKYDEDSIVFRGHILNADNGNIL